MDDVQPDGRERFPPATSGWRSWLRRGDALWPRWLWLRALGLIFLSAFYSLAFQITGLIGPRGILPAGEYLTEVRRAFGMAEALWFAPTLFWLSASDVALLAVVLLGAAASVLLVLNVAPRLCIAVAAVCFLSFIGAAQDFASYQSDGMLLEAAFISFFLAPRGLRPRLGAADPPSPLALFLLLWEWFRIYFESGVVKLLSGDLQWRSLTAMDHYYENGPLPTWLGWYVQQRLPHGFHAFTVVLIFAFELVIAWFAFLPRRFRLICFCLSTAFQVGDHPHRELRVPELHRALSRGAAGRRPLSPPASASVGAEAALVAGADRARMGPLRHPRGRARHLAPPAAASALAGHRAGALPDREPLRTVRGDDHRAATRSSSRARATGCTGRLIPSATSRRTR